MNGNTTLPPPIDEHNQLLHAFHSSADLPFTIVIAMHDVLSCLNKHVKDKVLTATRVAWEHIHLLMGSNTAHHKKSVKMVMEMPDGKVAINRKENMSIFTPHPTLREQALSPIASIRHAYLYFRGIFHRQIVEKELELP